MAGSDGAILLTTARWTSGSGGGGGGGGSGGAGGGVNGIHHQDSDPQQQQQLYLHEVVKAGDLPQMVRIVKGSYLGLGAPSLPNPSLSSTALIASAGSSLRLAVQCLKFKDNHKTVNVGPKLAIPETFDGYFEILNEDGRAVRCIESVAELARKSPDSCLVRQNVKAYYVPSDSVQQSPQPSPLGSSSSGGSDAVFVGDRTRTLTSGELLVLVGPVSSGRYLRCLDSRGDHVYLPMELRAKFSAVAKEDAVGSISGVHRIRALLNKRLPLTVRMVSGSPPAGLKVGQQFCYEMRLLASFREEMVVALPLVGSNKDGSQNGIVIIPPTVSLKLQLPANRQSLKASKEFQRLTERCLHQYGLMSDRIQVYDAHFSKNLRFDGQHWKVPVPLLLAPLRRSTSDLIHSITGSSSSKHSNHINSNNNNNKLTVSQSVEMLQQLPEEEEFTTSYGCPEKKKIMESDEILPEYDEIDQIYDYIRGFAPLPKNLKAEAENSGSRPANNKPTSEHRRNIYNKVISGGGVKRIQKTIDGIKPVPPPLETLPSKRAEAEQMRQQQQQSVPHQTDEMHLSPSPDPVPKPRMYRQRSAVPSSSGGGGGGGGGAGQRLYSKNPAMMMQQQRSNNNSPAVDQSSCKQSLTPSPLFNIRYKSMTNLLTATSAADSDTLGSSQSGGRCSGGSAGSAAVRTRHHLHPPLPLSKQQQQQQNGNGIYGRQISAPSHHGHHGNGGHHGPAARLFQLHRPRSLTDLLWGRSGSGGGGRHDDFHRSGSKSPLKIQQHPTVVADVLPSSSNRRRFVNGSHHQQLPASTSAVHGSSSKNSKHTIFYHL